MRRWCRERVPAKFKDEVRLEVTTRGKSISIHEWRPIWRGAPGEWTRTPIAQIRYEGAGTWTLYFGDRNGKWTMYFDLDANLDVNRLPWRTNVLAIIRRGGSGQRRTLLRGHGLHDSGHAAHLVGLLEQPLVLGRHAGRFCDRSAEAVQERVVGGQIPAFQLFEHAAPDGARKGALSRDSLIAAIIFSSVVSVSAVVIDLILHSSWCGQAVALRRAASHRGFVRG